MHAACMPGVPGACRVGWGAPSLRPPPAGDLCGGKNPAKTGEIKTVLCPSKPIGRFVTVDLDTKQQLTLCEVKVYGAGAPAMGRRVKQRHYGLEGDEKARHIDGELEGRDDEDDEACKCSPHPCRCSGRPRRRRRRKRSGGVKEMEEKASHESREVRHKQMQIHRQISRTQASGHAGQGRTCH